MSKVLLVILDKYGFDVAILSCLIFLVYKLGYKLFNNHLKHIDKKLDDATLERKDMIEDISDLGQRISKVEGRIKI